MGSVMVLARLEGPPEDQAGRRSLNGQTRSTGRTGTDALDEAWGRFTLLVVALPY